MKTTDAKLTIKHNVIEHLGLKLYKNKVGNVLAEIIANSWDADAEHVYVDLNEDVISVSDDGHGMSFENIRDIYLKVGKPKRSSGTELSSSKNRKSMGRKGLGKLAPFGIARDIEVTSIADGNVTRFKLPLDKILQQGNGDYEPVFSLVDKPMKDVHPNSFGAATEQFWVRLKNLEKIQGTLVEMTNITLKNLPKPEKVLMEIGKRFTVVLLENDFDVLINDIAIKEDNALPKFEFRIPEKGFTTIQLQQREIKFWVGFVESAEWPADQAGVGVFAHGKIAQTRPFFFGRKGKEVFQRYLYGVIEADWIDDGKDDKISTDRTAIDWSDPDLELLYNWGRKSVGEWVGKYEKHRKAKSFNKVETQAKALQEKGKMKRYTAPENKQIAKLVDEATAPLGKAPTANKAREELLIAVAKAWINAPSRKLLKKLWSNLAMNKSNPESFTAVINQMANFSVPESMGLAMNFAQRAYAITELYKLVKGISETNLQHLVESFPWILSPGGDLLTANQTLKTTIETVSKEIDEKKLRIGTKIKRMSPLQRADFVFLTDSETGIIEIVEIKGPTHVLSSEDRVQLTDYIDFVAVRHSAAKVRGTLIGNKPVNTDNLVVDTRIKIKSWDEILRECRAIYVDMLAVMIKHSDIDPDDSRTGDIVEFAGNDVIDLLKKLASKDESLNKIMSKAF